MKITDCPAVDRLREMVNQSTPYALTLTPAEAVDLLRYIERLAATLAEVQSICAGLAERVAKQSELLSKKAEKQSGSAVEPAPDKGIGIGCPICGAELFNGMPGWLLLSDPPKRQTICKDCGYRGTAPAGQTAVAPEPEARCGEYYAQGNEANQCIHPRGHKGLHQTALKRQWGWQPEIPPGSDHYG